jgi:dihydroxy-acid dehydratase
MERRRAAFTPVVKEVTSPLLKRYSRLVTSAANGAVYKR